uniref:Crystallin, beta A1b n=1 Tax=Oryzias melastigma TaxID=30732 RepID=A0A3B3BQC7_ORYME
MLIFFVFSLIRKINTFCVWISDYRVRSGVLPGQAYGVHCLLPEHHGVWDGEHSLPEGRVWSVCRISPAFGKSEAVFGTSHVRSSFFLIFLWILSHSWVGYEHSSFCGQQFVLEKGDYPRFEAYSGSNSYRIERMLSFRPICCANQKECRMTIYQMENMMGHQFELCDDYPSLQGMGWMCNEVGSMMVHCGAFVCYQYPGYRGHQYIMECDCRGGEYKCYREFGSHAQTPQIQSIRRIQH